MSDPREASSDAPSPDPSAADHRTPCGPPSPAELLEFLADSTLFHGLPEESLERLTGIAAAAAIGAGDELFQMGQACDTLHFVYSGTATLVKSAPDGRQRILHRALPGDMVGAIPFFDGKGYPATLRAEVDCIFVSFPRDELLRLLGSAPDLSLAMIGGVVTRMRRMVGIVEQVSFEDTAQRLWTYLVETSQAESESAFPRVIVSMPTREHIAQSIGTVREVVSRRLSRLVDDGHVLIEGRRLTLLEPRD